MTEPVRRKKAVVTPEMIEEMIRLRAEGITYREVAERLGVSEMTVYHRMRQAKEKAEAEKVEPVPDPEPESKKDDTAEKIAQMQAMRDEGMATDTIARKMRVSWDFVRQHTTKKMPSTPLPEPKGGELPESLRNRVPINGRGAQPKRTEGVQLHPKKLKPGKDTTDKPRLSLVPPGIIEAVGEVRTFGTEKYGCPENWRTVEPELYVDALMRHLVRYLRDPKSVDEESGLSHLAHMATNIAFLIEMENTTCGTE